MLASLGGRFVTWSFRLFDLLVGALVGGEQQNPVQCVQQLGFGRAQRLQILDARMEQRRGTVHDMRQGGLHETPSTDAVESGGERIGEAGLDVLDEDFLERFARLF